MTDDIRNVTGAIKGSSPLTAIPGRFAQVRDPHGLGGQRDAAGNYIVRPVRKENRRRNGFPGGEAASDTDFDPFIGE